MPASEPRDREHTETISATDHTYRVRVGGTLDGENTREPTGYAPFRKACELNRFARVENVGEELLVNPWIVVNGRRDWRSIESVLREILDDGMSDADKARAIWEFARRHCYHFTSADDEVKDTVKMLNVYGYTLCWDEAYTVSNLWQAAGLKVRRGYPHGHCTTEVWHDGAWHLLDSDEHLLYLLRDNRTVASEADLSRDHDLVRRGHAYGILQKEDPAREHGAAALFFFEGRRTGGRPVIGDHEMRLTLRPGESLQWEWESCGKHHGIWDPPPQSANGRMVYRPLAADADPAAWAETWENLTARHRPGGRAELTPGTADVEGVAVYRIESPYVIVGGTVELDVTLGKADTLQVDLSSDGRTWRSCADLSDPRKGPAAVPLDPFFPSSGPACYTCLLRLRVVGGEADSLPAISGLALVTDLQMAPLSLPALEVGDNEVRFTCDGPDSPGARVTHGWTERDADPPPRPPGRPVCPADGARVRGTQITFEWPASAGATDYEFRLGEREDVRWALSPVFEKLMSRTPSEGGPRWRVPTEGLLNPGKRYWWRVRVRNADGLWGPWSRSWSFVPRAPAVPAWVRCEADCESRTIALVWKPGAGGTEPACYEVYGSDERGFTPGRGPYPVVTGNGRTETFPANLIGRVQAGALTMRVAGPRLDPGRSGFAFYRVVAVDAQGARSGPSDYAEAPRPMVLSLPETDAVAGQTWSYAIRVTRSIGDLRCESAGPERYRSAFRDGDVLRFLLDEGPPWLSLDERTGLLRARPGPAHVGTHTVTLRVQNGQGGVDMQGFDLRVRPALQPT